MSEMSTPVNTADVSAAAFPGGPLFADLMPPAVFPVGAEVSPDGSMVAYVRSTPDGRHTVFVRDTIREADTRELAVFRGHSVMALAWSPDNATVAVNADTEHNPIPAIYLLPLDGGEQRTITGPQGYPAMMGNRPFNHAGTAIALATVGRDPSIIDVVIYDLTDGRFRHVEGVPGRHLAPAEFSPDDRWLLIAVVVDNARHGAALLDLDTYELIDVIAPDAQHDAGLWLADSTGFFYSTNRDREFAALARYCIADQSVTIEAERPWDITGFGFQNDTSVIISNADGIDIVEAMYQGQALDLPDVVHDSVITHSSLNPDGRWLCLTSTTATRAPEIVLVDLAENTAFTLTETQPAALAQHRPVAPQLVRFDAPDGQAIPAWSYRPPTDEAVPVVLLIHGGPEVQARPAYEPVVQWYISRGIGVLAPNIRGSVGYGTSFREAIYGDWGGVDLVDLRAAVEYLRAQPWVRPGRIIAVGESYGGFAVLSCLTRLADLGWAAGVAGAAPSDLFAMAVATPQTWTQGMRALVGDPVEDRDRLIERSPINHVDQIQAPLMVRQPVRDRIVRADQTDRFVKLAREAGAQVTYVQEEAAEHGALDLAYYIQRWNEIGMFVLDVLTD